MYIKPRFHLHKKKCSNTIYLSIAILHSYFLSIYLFILFLLSFAKENMLKDNFKTLLLNRFERQKSAV